MITTQWILGIFLAPQREYINLYTVRRKMIETIASARNVSPVL